LGWLVAVRVLLAALLGGAYRRHSSATAAGEMGCVGMSALSAALVPVTEASG